MQVDKAPRWADLESRIEAFLCAAGYACRRNVVVTGRSGASHEIDVVAERSDPVARFRVAVECKAWNRPIDKEAVAKLAFVVADVAGDKGILVALSGGTPGAERAAADLGIELWGPEEVEGRLGSAALLALTAEPAAVAVSGLPQRCPDERARRLLEREARGGLGRGRERVRWAGPVWVAHHLVVVATTEPGRAFLGRITRRSTTHAHLYDGVTGVWWRCFVPSSPAGALECGRRVEAAIPAGRVASAIRRAVERRDGAGTSATRERWAAALDDLGLPGDAEAVTVEETSTLYWPFWLGLLRTRSGQQRVVAVDTSTPAGAVSHRSGEAFTTAIGHFIRSLGI